LEWVETTGRTLDDAKDAALDQLGVDEQDAEFEVVDEPKSGLFGLTRREARVRARVRPTAPRPKVDRRDRRRKSSSGRGGRSSNGGTGGSSGGSGRRGAKTSRAASGSETAPVEAARNEPSGSADRPAGRPPKSRAPRPPAEPAAPSSDETRTTKDAPMTNDDVSVDEQATIISEFLEGLLDAYGLDGELSSTKIDDETIEIQVSGSDLGLLIGPKGQTLSAIQDLSRTVVQRQASGTHHGRVRLDVAGYRQRRREALERFAQSVAEDVKASGQQKALEPMNPADRKIVHDTVNEIDGVSTVSEGEDQRRRVVIIPDA
jgi:spoIIIJ-associated protein